MLGVPFEHLHVVKLVADLEPHHAALRGKFLQEVVRHRPRDIVEAAQSVMRGQDRVGTRVEDR